MSALNRLAQRRADAVFMAGRRMERLGLARQPIQQVKGTRALVNRQPVISFTSAHYLGFNCCRFLSGAISRAAQRWGVSLGIPRSLAVDPFSARLEAALAELVGQERALLYPSTTHAALDLIPLLTGPGGKLFVDAWSYPISLEGVAVACQRGAELVNFPHNDWRELARLLRHNSGKREMAVVCDGVYPADGRPAALWLINRLARESGASLYVDDAHGLGVLGSKPTRSRPYGQGGGGTPLFMNCTPGNLVHVASLSKAFGVPLAFAAGPRGFIDYLRTVSEVHVHSSPPAIPLAAAALAALRLNKVWGERLRQRLLRNVHRFRSGALRLGLELPNDPNFPLQAVAFTGAEAARTAGKALLDRGIWTMVQEKPSAARNYAALLFVITARHTSAQIDQALAALAGVTLPRRYEQNTDAESRAYSLLKNQTQ